MGKKKKDTMELRFYEVPQNEYVLALLGDSWIRDYGHDESNLHFHNLMEIGYCKHGTGELILNEESKPYEPAMVSIIPQNYPHVTISDTDSGPSFWEYLFFDPMVIIHELYPDNPVIQKKILQMVNQKALFFHEWENPGVSVLVKMIMDEMRQKKKRFHECVRGLMTALFAELLRMCENDVAEDAIRKKAGVSQITPALEYVRNEYANNIRVEELAKASHMSETHFRRVFESYMNMSPMDYINLMRVQKACDIMKKTNDSMDVVAQKVGFTTTSTFNRNFKKYLNTSPYQWKISPENYERKLLNYNISALKGW